MRHELRAPAYALCREPRRQAPLHKADLAGQERIALLLISSDRAAQHHQQIGFRSSRNAEVVDARVEILNMEAHGFEQGLERA